MPRQFIATAVNRDGSSRAVMSDGQCDNRIRKEPLCATVLIEIIININIAFIVIINARKSKLKSSLWFFYQMLIVLYSGSLALDWKVYLSYKKNLTVGPKTRASEIISGSKTRQDEKSWRWATSTSSMGKDGPVKNHPTLSQTRNGDETTHQDSKIRVF